MVCFHKGQDHIYIFKRSFGLPKGKVRDPAILEVDKSEKTHGIKRH